MSHRSRRPDDRDRSHSSSHSSHKYDKYDKYDKYERRHRRDDSMDRSDHYHSSSRRNKTRSKYRSRSRSPSHGSKSHSRHHRSRSRSPGYTKYHEDYQSRPHHSRNYKELPDSKSRRDSSEHSQSKYNAAFHYKPDGSSSSKHKSKSDVSEHAIDRASTSISYQFDENSESNDTASSEPKKNPTVSTDSDAELEEEKQRIQKETLQRLQKHLEKEGKAYPPPKPQASHPIFANDGSFLEMFKTMQGNLQQQQSTVEPQKIQPTPIIKPANPISRSLPVKRRGAKILKTGIVQKQRVVEETEEAQPSDSWNAYLKEVKRYKTVTCSDENMTRSLVK